MNKYKILAVGEVLFDVIDGIHRLGGAPFNVAAHMARLGNKGYILSAIGEDELGDQILQEADLIGVNTSLIRQMGDKPTGTVQVEFIDGEPDYEIVSDVAWDYLEADLEQLDQEKWSVIAFGSLAQRSPHNLAFFQSMFNRLHADWIYFDCNLRQNYFSRSVIADSLNYANIGKFNEHEIRVVSQLLFGQLLEPVAFAERLNTEYGVSLVVYTWGKAGSKAWYQGELYSAPSEKVETKDTVGAGDAFSAGFLHSWIRTLDLDEALKKGNRLGGYVASHSGAIPEYDDQLKSYYNLQE